MCAGELYRTRYCNRFRYVKEAHTPRGRYRPAQLLPEAEVGSGRLVLQQGADDHNSSLPTGENLAAGEGQGRILGVIAGECQQPRFREGVDNTPEASPVYCSGAHGTGLGTAV